jgi:hypothetical protein
VFGAKYDMSRHIPVNAHLIKGGAYDVALYDLALIDEETGSSKRISNTCNILKVICSDSIITLHPDLENTTRKKLCFVS